MKAIEYLEQIGKLDRAINRKIRAAERWREMAYKAAGEAVQPKFNPNRSVSAPYEKCIVKADELEREITADIDRLADLKMDVEGRICMIDDEVSQDILRLRYVELYLWEDVIVAVDKSRSQIFKRHRKAIERLDEILKNETMMRL